MVEHRTLNPLVPSSSLGLSILQNPVLDGVLFCLHTDLSLIAIEISEDVGSIKFMFRTGCRPYEVNAFGGYRSRFQDHHL
jgi:hypothetical protein